MERRRTARNSIRPVNLSDLKEGVHSRDARIFKLAKQLGVDRYELRSYILNKIKPGFKAFGQKITGPKGLTRYVDDVSRALTNKRVSKDLLTDKNLKEMSKVLSQKHLENLQRIERSNKLGPRSKVVPFKESPHGPNPSAPIRDIPRLKWLAKGHDIRWRTIQNALDAGANPKKLLKQLSSETIDSMALDEHLQKTFKKKNAKRRARDKLHRSTGSKIVKFENADKIAKSLFDYQKQFGTKHGLIPTDTIKQLLQKGYGLERLKTQLKVRLQPPTDWHTKVIDRNFKETLGLIDDKGNPTRGNKIIAGPNAKFKPMRSLRYLSLDAFHTGKPTAKLSRDNLKLWNAYADHKNEEHRKWDRRNRRTNLRRWERIETGRARQLKIKNLASGLKGAGAQLGAGIAINYLSDKYVQPHVDKFGQYLGKHLKHFADEIDRKHEQRKKNRK